MPRGDQKRPLPPRTFRRVRGQVKDPTDQTTGLAVPPEYVTRQGPTGLFGTPGLLVDARAGAGSYDRMGYIGVVLPPQNHQPDDYGLCDNQPSQADPPPGY